MIDDIPTPLRHNLAADWCEYALYGMGKAIQMQEGLEWEASLKELHAELSSIAERLRAYAAEAGKGAP